MAEDVLSTAVRGLEIRVGFDESAFEGAGCYLLGAVLAPWLTPIGWGLGLAAGLLIGSLVGQA